LQISQEGECIFDSSINRFKKLILSKLYFDMEKLSVSSSIRIFFLFIQSVFLVISIQVEG